MQYYQTKKFKELNKKWNQKLQKTGFEDIEREVNGTRLIKQYASNWARNADQEIIEAKSKYIDLLQQKVNEFIFEDRIEQFIMGNLSQGNKISEIVEELELAGIDIHRQTVRFIKRRYEVKWKIRKWTLKEQNLKAPTK